MANTFKMINDASVGTNLTTVYTVPASTTAVVIGIMLANVGSSTVGATMQLVSTTSNTGAPSSNETVHLVKNVPIVENTSLEIMGGNKVILQTGDALKLQSSLASSLDITVSYMEMT